jgi:hypothetical protein
VKLLTWNCNRGSVTAKLALLAHLEPTVAVITECSLATTPDSSAIWVGEPGRLGVAVSASSGYLVEPLPQREVPRYTFPLQVSGPLRFLLLAVWSKADPEFRYVKAVIRAVECYRDLIVAQPTILIGDFNSNTIWDYKRPAHLSHSGLVQQLSALGMVSAYHAFHGERHGAESRATLYLLKQRRRAYHVDYCFLPKVWLPFVRSVEVGSYEDWIRFSDHAPLSVGLDLPIPERTRERRAGEAFYEGPAVR